MPRPARVYLDLSHLGRHVTGLERISIELFQDARFEGADVRHVRSRSTLGMILVQQLWLPLLALLNPRAYFVFPGFPSSPLFALWPRRTVLYVHDLFLITRKPDLSAKARLYMARPFAFAVRHLKYFLVNSETTAAELARYVTPGAAIVPYRPVVRNVFALDSTNKPAPSRSKPLQLVSLGTLEPRKNYTAAAAIRDRLAALWPSPVSLGIVGRDGWGEERARLEAREGVTLHGYLPGPEIKRLIESADLYLCTSHEEGLGLPLLEAQFSGIPVAAPDQPVFREVLGASGLYIDPADPEASARIIRDALSDPQWISRARDAARTNLERWNARAARDRARASRMFEGGLDSAFESRQEPHEAGATALPQR